MTSRSRLMQAHASAQRGFYFDTLREISPGVFLAMSNRIKDPFWNFAFFEDDSLATGAAFDLIDREMQLSQRTPAVLLPVDSEHVKSPAFLRLFKEFSGDTWMVAPASLATVSVASGLSIDEIRTARDIKEAVSVFADAYTTPDDDGVGYTGLPLEYLEAYEFGLRRAGEFGSKNYIGRSGGQPVAIASLYFAQRLAGLYNVAVSRSHRLRGYGLGISQFALANADGVDGTFLQTEPESAVEAMYAKAGFSVAMRATVWSRVSE